MVHFVSMKTVTASAPATVANLACGFDVFGLALHQPCDEVHLMLNTSGQVLIHEIHGNGKALPTEAAKNTAGVAVISFLKAVSPGYGADIVLNKRLPVGSGMGSSAASAAAALVAANYALGDPLSRKELIPFALEAERVACGSAHADNVAPALMGGLVLIRDSQLLDIIRLPVPDELVCVLVHPHIEIKTRDARMALKQSVPLSLAVKQWANTAAMVAGFLQADYELIGRAMEDFVAEPVRSIFIPGYARVKEEALRAGALGCGISGSGPSVFALCKGYNSAHEVVKAMHNAMHATGLSCDCFISAINQTGAGIINRQSH